MLREDPGMPGVVDRDTCLAEVEALRGCPIAQWPRLKAGYPDDVRSGHRFRRGAVIASLGFAATPTFAVMALLTGIAGDSPMDMLCQPSGGLSLLGSMTMMYLLMAVFHAGPWLRRVAGSRRGVRRLCLRRGPRSLPSRG